MLLIICLVYAYVSCCATSDVVSDSGIAGETVDGELLVKMGRRTKQPLLTLIGLAIRNLHQCSEWTQWTACSTRRKGYFGTMNRTRLCNHTGPDKEPEVNIEEDIRICEGKCPTNYNVTKNGFCFKLSTVQMGWDDAERMCQNDGGHLADINSETKFNDVKKMTEGWNSYILIDGRRKDVSSHWKNVQNSALKTFFWHSSQPDNGSTELCIVLRNDDTRLWHDAACTGTYFPLCEIFD